jgi:hypothetical protein
LCIKYYERIFAEAKKKITGNKIVSTLSLSFFITWLKGHKVIKPVNYLQWKPHNVITLGWMETDKLAE